MKPLPDLPGALEASIGLRVDQIDTPALVVDLDAMERNIARMADFARKHQVLWRPHAKMHKSAEIALLLQRAGAVGACVQKTAEAMAQAAPQARIDVLVEIDVGQGRCGVPPGEPALALAQAVARLTPLRFAGLHAYHGRAQHLHSAADRRDAIAAAVQAARHTRDLLTNAGLPVPLVTGSGTGTLVHEAASGVYGELQAGSFLFMDADYARNEREPAQPAFEQALFVKTQVISACSSHAVCDAGHKSHAIDSGLPTVALLPPGRALRYANGGDEHGVLYADGPQARLPALGQMLWLVPGHCDPTVNLHNFLIGVRGGLTAGVVERIIRVDARGALT
ncbi:DSD1 family PLP-dependent enzyme [Acidovorax sp. 35-64-16]|uniref:DSD1 family PLP-dependent enzyme n=1 Tax=Acidovorax sp. 35-64-16 TaxID=1970312 RepID=UPI000BC9452F|nr:DSD1 family PLP-dependent enzyme [Acidovorax sp. 35-64-16]OYY27744.1 MAG: alanine racemase [Acidovorax sp. 35-64-16]